MPLRDHYRPPLGGLSKSWAVQSAWATALADQLCQRLPDHLSAFESVRRAGKPGANVDSYPPTPGEDRWRSVWQPRTPDDTGDIAYPPCYEVSVREFGAGANPLAVIKLACPEDNATFPGRRAFAIRCVDLLQHGAGLILLDMVTVPAGNLVEGVYKLLGREPDAVPTPGKDLYSVAFRPVRRGGRDELDIWTESFAVGESLPTTVPLRVGGDLFVPVDFEASYMDVLRNRRLLR